MDLSPAIIWAILGIALIIAEIATTSFFMLFFGIAALVVAGIVYGTGLDNRAWEILLFALLGLAGVLIFRKKIMLSFKDQKEFKIDEHQKIKLSQNILAHSEGQVFYQGTPWTAINVSDFEIAAGSHAIIVKTEGVKLLLRPAE